MGRFVRANWLIPLLMLCAAQATTPRHHAAAATTPAPAKPAAKPAPPAPVQPIVKVTMPTIGASTGLPLPRYASLKTSPVELRVGPGFRYPVVWIYKKRDLPVLIFREYDVWRQIRTPDGSEGWVQALKLQGKREFITLPGTHALRSTTEDDASVVAQLDAGVVGHIDRCAIGSGWCKVSVAGLEGWLLRSDFFGAMPDEVLP